MTKVKPKATAKVKAVAFQKVMLALPEVSPRWVVRLPSAFSFLPYPSPLL